MHEDVDPLSEIGMRTAQGGVGAAGQAVGRLSLAVVAERPQGLDQDSDNRGQRLGLVVIDGRAVKHTHSVKKYQG